MSKLELTDTVQDVFLKMAEGNPGALNCLFAMISKKDWFGGLDPVMLIIQLDDMEIYGSNLYMLWNDCCNQDLVQMELVIRNYQCGRLTKEVIMDNLKGGRGTPFKNLVPLSQLFERRP